jgi:D-amino-acid dehydrogenase
VREGDRAVALRTERGSMGADAAVLATGALAPQMAGELGCRLPVQPGKGYSMTMRPPKICPRVPIIFQEHKVMVTPMRSGYRLGSTMEFSGYDESLNRRRLDLLKRGAARYLREPYTEPVEEEWFGWRPMTPDGKPILDRSPRMSNVCIATGHNMLGLTLAPVTGKLIAEILDGRPTHLDIRPFSARRF